ncbi:MAG: hypothetical protein WD226_12115 [Planctomycetota bacterium]
MQNQLLPLGTLSFLFLALPLVGCGDATEGAAKPSSTPASSEAATANSMPSALWADAPLAEARDVKDVRDTAADGQAVVLRGTLQDFGDLATFRLVEDSLDDCTEMSEEDHCPTPWDYCCEDPEKLRKYTVNVEFLDGEFPAAWSLRGERGLDRLSEVTVAGKLRLDEAGNLRLEADRIAMQ